MLGSQQLILCLMCLMCLLPAWAKFFHHTLHRFTKLFPKQYGKTCVRSVQRMFCIFKQISTSAAGYLDDFQVWYFLEAFHRKYASPIIMISDVILNRDCGLQDKLCNRDFFKFVSDFCSIIAA